MYKISFRYSNGKTGTCIENGTTLLFQDKTEAQRRADEFNNAIDPICKEFFPTWYVEKV